jgi:hypothetical protein
MMEHHNFRPLKYKKTSYASPVNSTLGCPRALCGSVVDPLVPYGAILRRELDIFWDGSIHNIINIKGV